jgi:hypothetical protein
MSSATLRPSLGRNTLSTIAPDDPAPVHVDLDGLADFATRLHKEVSRLQVNLTDMIGTYNYGVTFGEGLPTPGMNRVRDHYQACLAGMVEQLNSFVLTGTILADAANGIAQRYRSADDLAHASVEDVEAAVRTAASANPDSLTMPTATNDSISLYGGRKPQ